METCQTCDGSGWTRDAILIRQEPCPKCYGSGKVKLEEDPAVRLNRDERINWSEVEFYFGGKA